MLTHDKFYLKKKNKKNSLSIIIAFACLYFELSVSWNVRFKSLSNTKKKKKNYNSEKCAWKFLKQRAATYYTDYTYLKNKKIKKDKIMKNNISPITKLLRNEQLFIIINYKRNAFSTFFTLLVFKFKLRTHDRKCDGPN